MVIVIIVLIISIIVFIHFKYKASYNLINTGMIKVEEKLNSNLLKRFELLKDSEKLIKKILKTKKEIYNNLADAGNTNNIIELDRNTITYLNEFMLIKDKYEILEKNDDFNKLSFIIDETEDLISAYKKYYNDIGVKYNKQINKFPFKLLNRIKGIKEIEFFDI